MIGLLYIGATVTFAFGLLFLIDGCVSLQSGTPWVRDLAAAAIMLAGFAGFYLSLVRLP